MPELFVFLIKVNIALVLFCAGYYLVLRKLTFYTLNRAYLITAITFSSTYPFVDLSAFAQRHQEIVMPVQNVVINWQAPAQQFVQRAAYWNWLEVLFWTGAIILAMRLMSQLFSLYLIYRRSTEKNINGQKVRVVSADIGPFSFWKSIYINPDKLSPVDLQNILQHEQIHVNEWHTLDILLTEISVIFYWFNPGIWMMKKAVRENIEFITDRKILQKGADSKAYQYSLLNITFNQPAPVAITNNFNFSTLKKRIKMMNSKRSSNINLTRYAFLMPMVVVCLFAFSLSKAEVVKTSPVYKSIAKTMHSLNNIVLSADTTPKPKKASSFSLRADTARKTKRVIYVTTNDKNADKFDINIDTGKSTNGAFTINLRKSINADSITTVMINGKMGTIEDLKKINPELVNSIDVRSYGGNLPNTISLRKNPNGLTYSTEPVIVLNGKKIDKAGLANISTQDIGSIEVIKDNNVIIVNGKAIPGGTANIRTNQNLNYNLSFDSTQSNDMIEKAVTVRDYGNRANINYGDGVSLSTSYATIGNASIDFSNKLIIVDGKEATEKQLKKIALSDIKSMQNLQGRQAIAKYGEKAKGGVLVVVTKK